MNVEYLHCPFCGYEMLKGGEVKPGPSYTNGRVVFCPECDEQTFEFKVADTHPNRPKHDSLGRAWRRKYHYLENHNLTPTPDAATI